MSWGGSGRNVPEQWLVLDITNIFMSRRKTVGLSSFVCNGRKLAEWKLITACCWWIDSAQTALQLN